MKIEVLHFRWGFEDDVYEGGVQEIEKPSAKLLAGIGAAAAVPDPPLRVVSASKAERAAIGDAVESDEDSLKAYDAAQRSGDWQVGNVAARLVQLRDQLAAHERSLDDDSLDGRLTDEQLALTRFSLEQTVSIQKRMDKGATFEQAADAWHLDRRASG